MLTDQAPTRKAKRGPREKGKFVKSAATKRREIEGTQPARKPGKQAAGGHARDIASKTVFYGKDQIKDVSRLLVANPEAKPIVVKAFLTKEQKLLADLRTSLIGVAPKAVQYIEDAILGTKEGFEGVPHSVRMQGALGAIDRALGVVQTDPEHRDPSEIPIDELYQRSMALSREIASRTAEDAEVERGSDQAKPEIEPKVGIAAPLATNAGMD